MNDLSVVQNSVTFHVLVPDALKEANVLLKLKDTRQAPSFFNITSLFCTACILSLLVLYNAGNRTNRGNAILIRSIDSVFLICILFVWQVV